MSTRAQQQWILETNSALISPLLATLRAFEEVQQRWHPPRVRRLAQHLTPFATALEERRARFSSESCPEEFEALRAALAGATQQALLACTRFIEGPDDRRALGALLSSTRCYARACEALIPFTDAVEAVDRFLLEPGTQPSEGAGPSNDAAHARGFHVRHNGRDTRGGYSVYVPEQSRTRYPLIVALHGGGGHGADFLWTWLRQARSRGFILASPTSRETTWSLREPDLDIASLLRMVEEIRGTWPVDSDHVMITGWSDGGTYGMMAAVEPDSPFTHISSCSGSLHPRVVQGANVARTRGKPFYLVHGSLDYMFPVENSYRARDYLLHVGADVEYHEVAHLSHNWAARECLEILPWFDPTLVPNAGG